MAPTMLLLAVLLVSLALGALVWAAATSLQPQRSRAVANLQRGGFQATVTVDTGPTTLEALARRLTPAPFLNLLERQHARAGRPREWTVSRLLVMKLLWVPLAGLGIVLLILGRPSPVLVLLAFAVAIGIYFLPDLLLLSRGQERDQKIQRELADTLDQMTIAVEAGLGFDAAMTRASANGKGVLAEEFSRTLQDIRMGRSRTQSFEDLAKRSEVADLRQFVRAIVQADAFGISIGDVLRTQAAEMRLKRRQRAEEKAQKVPVAVIFPLILCILPSLFIVVIGPAALSIFEMFSSIGG